MSPEDSQGLPFRSPRARFTVYHPTPDAGATRGHRQDAERLARRIFELNSAHRAAVEEFVDVLLDYSGPLLDDE